VYCPGIDHALRVAIEAHDGQFRKGAGRIPYAVHPLHVAMMLARWTMDEHVIQAGILHDVVEDCDGWTVDRVRAEFGDAVADIVAQLTEDKSRTWAERKRHAVEHVAHMSAEAAAVKAVDKLHNLESLIADLARADDHERVWQSFKGHREGTLRYADELVTALERRVEPELAAALRAALVKLERASGPAPRA
jgi:myo-inositol-1(or 4)-monophosphatase